MTSRNLTIRLRTAYADLHHILGIDNDQSCRRGRALQGR